MPPLTKNMNNNQSEENLYKSESEFEHTEKMFSEEIELDQEDDQILDFVWEQLRREKEENYRCPTN